MTVEFWLEAAIADARARGLDDLPRLLETLAGATMALRQADWNRDATGDARASAVGSGVPPPDPA
jgi:hypothetical protein